MKDEIKIGNAGISIGDWKQEQRKLLEEKLNQVESNIERIRLIIQERSSSPTIYVSIVKSWENRSVIVRFSTTYYLHSNEVFKFGEDISIADEIKKHENNIETLGKEIKALTVNHQVIERPTVSGKQPSAVEAIFLIKISSKTT
jgi:hypothetical protein